MSIANRIMILSKCCNEPVVAKAVGEDDSIYYCPLCEHCCEGETYDDESPQEVALQFNLEYIGFTRIWKGLSREDKYAKRLMYFNDLETKSTIAVYDLSELEDKVTESRKKFKGE